MVSTSPTRSAPTNAPRIEPMPSITITTKARMRMFSPMPTCTARSGPSIAPASAERRAEREDHREETPDVDTHHDRHLPVRGARAHQHADPGLRHQDIQQQGHTNAHGDDRQAIGRVLHAARQLHRAGEPARRIEHERLVAPDDAHHLVRDQDDRERGEHLREVIALVKLAQEAHLQRGAHQRGRQERERQRHPERPVASANVAIR